jgi:hypothetical protein
MAMARAMAERRECQAVDVLLVEDDPGDVLHANAYVSKPVDFERFMDVIRQIDNFFITVVKLAR